jgi:hypothetical protein
MPPEQASPDSTARRQFRRWIKQTIDNAMANKLLAVWRAPLLLLAALALPLLAGAESSIGIPALTAPRRRAAAPTTRCRSRPCC